MSEDIYETSDLPEADQQVNREETFDSVEIERIHLDVGSAFERFKDRTLRTDDVDFSDWLSRRRRKGYGGGEYVLEVIGSDATDQTGLVETAQQKFNRLHHEINELAEQLKSIKSSAENAAADTATASSVSVEEVVALQSQLKTLQVEQVLGSQASINLMDPNANTLAKITESLEKVKAGKTTGKPSEKAGEVGQVTYELLMNSGTAQQGQSADKIAQLEGRLAKLEKSLGADPTQLGQVMGAEHKSVCEAIESLSDRVQMLDAGHVDAVEARLAALLLKYKQLSEAKQESPIDAEHSAKINELHEMMSKWQPLCSSLPQIVSRLQALQLLHEHAMQVSQAVTQLDACEQQLTKTLDNDSALLSELKSSFMANMDSVRANIESMDGRIKKLAK